MDFLRFGAPGTVPGTDGSQDAPGTVSGAHFLTYLDLNGFFCVSVRQALFPAQMARRMRQVLFPARTF